MIPRLCVMMFVQFFILFHHGLITIILLFGSGRIFVFVVHSFIVC